MRRIAHFDDWIGIFHQWRRDVGVAGELLDGFAFEARFDPPSGEPIAFGHFARRPRWPTVLHVPDQRIRDALLHLIVVQGDTEFASVEQQRRLLDTAPSDQDRLAIERIMAEEMRHGWQMAALLCEHFGSEGRREAAKLLERRAWTGSRLLGSFNEPVDHWIDFFAYTELIDRDGKYQLTMLSGCAFDPLSRSMGPMLKEESFHLGTGHTGLKRILRAGVVEPEVLQRYLNKWVPTAFDLFGTDGSSSAHWAYVWGLKGRFDERSSQGPADPAHLNEAARAHYRDEVVRLVAELNRLIPDRDRWLAVPDLAFNRRIGIHADGCFDLTGRPVDRARYPGYLASVLPTASETERLRRLTATPGWIEAPASGGAVGRRPAAPRVG